MSFLTKTKKPNPVMEAETTQNNQPTEPDKKRYLVRIDFNANFIAQLNLGYIESTAPREKLLFELGDYVVKRRLDFCKSFVVIYVDDVNEYSVEQRILETWGKLYPENKNAVRVTAYINDESKARKVLEEIYCGYIGWDKYCQLVTDIARERALVLEAKASDFVISQNYLVSMDSGCGFSTLVGSFADFMDKVGYFEEPSDSYYEYIMNNDEDADETTTKDFLNSLWADDMKPCCVGLDISYFLPKDKHTELRKLLTSLYRLQKKYIFLFRIPYLEEKARKEIYDVIEDIVNVNQIVFEPYNELNYCELFDDIITKHNMSLTDETAELFLERLRLEKRDGRFYGFKTVAKLAEEAILLKIKNTALAMKAGQTPNFKVMNVDDIDGFLDDYKKKDKSGYDELHELIGMEEIEKRIREIVAQVKLAQANDKLDTPCLHMRFTGAPGTGKTTVARIMGMIFKEEGILRKGNFFEYGGRDLCGKFVGQTAPKTAQICRDAYGSVLFIDEAYALYAGDNETSQNDYGREAIATLIAEMENHRSDMVVIMAGYTEDMSKLMEANSGLRSRMPYVIEFKSYTREQLTKIFMNYVNRHFTAGEGLKEAVEDYFANLADSYLDSKEFANARFVRNLYERTWSKAATRVTATGTSDLLITVEDFNNAKADKEFSEKLYVAKKIGF